MLRLTVKWTISRLNLYYYITPLQDSRFKAIGG